MKVTRRDASHGGPGGESLGSRFVAADGGGLEPVALEADPKGLGSVRYTSAIGAKLSDRRS